MRGLGISRPTLYRSGGLWARPAYGRWSKWAARQASIDVIKIINSAPIRIIDRISLPQRCHLSIGVPIVQGLARR